MWGNYFFLFYFYYFKDKSKGEDDSILSLSVRWNHIGIVEYLLNLSWPINYLKEAHICSKGVKNKILIRMLESSIRKYNKNNKKGGCFICF